MNDDIEGKIDGEGAFELHPPFWKRLKEALSAPEVSERLVRAVGRKRTVDWYDIRTYRLDNARDDEFVTDFPRDGDCILVLSITSGASASIKYDSSVSDSFDLVEYRKLRHNFSNLFLTNTALGGATLQLLFGKGDWEVTRHHPEEEIMAINADTVDSLHASASVEAGKLLALGADGFFPDNAVRNLQNEVLANRPATPVVGDVFVSLDTSQTFICYTAGVWTDISTSLAIDVSIADAGGYYAGADVEATLQELGPYMADVDGFPDELKNLVAAEIQQLENIGLTTISAAQWGYLGVCTAAGGAILDDATPAAQLATLGLSTNLADLTDAEAAQLENIGPTTISADQWGFLGAIDAYSTYINQQFNNLLKNGSFESWSAGVALAPDGWTLVAGTVDREAATVRIGAYSCNVNLGVANARIRQDFTGVTFANYGARTFTFGCWVHSDEAAVALIRVSTIGGTDVDTDVHTGGGVWEWLTATVTLDAGATGVRVECENNNGGNDHFFDGAILVEGTITPAFCPKNDEVIYLTDDMTDTDWDGDAKSDADSTILDLSAFGNGLPPRIKAVLLTLGAMDSASAGAACYVRIGPDAVDSHFLWHNLEGVPNGKLRTSTAWVPCDPNGDIYIEIDATGALTMNVWIWVWGYVLGE